MPMIQINTLKIAPDGKSLIVNAAVKDLSYYENVYIGSLKIDDQDSFSEFGPSSNPIWQDSYEKKKTVDITIDIAAFDPKKTSLNEDILYCWFEATGTPSSDTPCGMDNTYTLGIAINLRPIYNKGMAFFKEMENNCSMPKEFINFILEYKALDLALKTENYIQANKYWNKFFKGTKVTSIKTGCGCS
jgi:hypothetical protein